MLNYLSKLLDTSDFPARWSCGRWDNFTGYLHIFSDIGIWLAYFSIPVMLLFFLHKRRDVHKLSTTLLMFAGFILSCGLYHLGDAVMFYYPAYRLLGLWKLWTCIISWATVFMLVKQLPVFLAMKHPMQVQAEKEALENESKFEQLANSMPQIVWRAQPDGIVDYCNDRWYEYTGHPKVNGVSWQGVISPEDLPRLEEVWSNCVKTGETYEHEARFYDKTSRQYRWHLIRARPIRDKLGNIIRWFGSSTDIHEMQLAKYALQATHAELGIRVEERTSELAEANYQLAEANKRLAGTNRDLEQFAAVAAHDLQDPLRRMNAYLRLIHKKFGNKESEEYIKVIIEANEQMKAMTNNLLKYARDSEQLIQMGVFDMNEVVKLAVKTLALAIGESRAKVKITDMPKQLLGDEIQIQRVWQNLIQNAIKYRKADTPLVIEIGHGIRDDEHVFWVTDNGEGVAKENREKLFVVFRRIRKDDKGVGFGLAICNKIIQRHGGRIWMDSVSDGGSTFFFTMPKNECE